MKKLLTIITTALLPACGLLEHKAPEYGWQEYPQPVSRLDDLKQGQKLPQVLRVMGASPTSVIGNDDVETIYFNAQQCFYPGNNTVGFSGSCSISLNNDGAFEWSMDTATVSMATYRVCVRHCE